LASASDDGVRLWDLEAGHIVAHLALGPSRSAIFDPRGGSLVTSSRSGLRRWPMTSRDSGQAVQIGPPQVLRGPVDNLGTPAAMTHEGRFLAAIGESGTTAVFDLTQPDDKAVFEAPDSAGDFVAISPDGRWVASARHRGVRIWDVARGSQVKECLPDTSQAQVAFSPAGQWLVTGTGKKYRFWRVGTWEAGLDIPHPHLSRFVPLAISPCGKMLAVAKSPRLVQLLDTATGDPLATLESQYPITLFWLAFGPDGNQLAAVSLNHAIQVWDLQRIRQQLAAMGLDWAEPPNSPDAAPRPSRPLSVDVLREETTND
jgi:WD40 repeat protein